MSMTVALTLILLNKNTYPSRPLMAHEVRNEHGDEQHLKSVHITWHPEMVGVLELTLLDRITARPRDVLQDTIATTAPLSIESMSRPSYLRSPHMSLDRSSVMETRHDPRRRDATPH